MTEHRPATITGADIFEQLLGSGIEYIVSVPDITTSEGLLWPLATTEKRFKLIRVCKEDEGVSICGALSFCNKRALLLMQHTGLLDSINAIRASACEYRLPVAMMVGLLNKEPDVPPRQSSHYGVRIVEPILGAMAVPHDLLEVADDAARIKPAIERSYSDSWPTVLMIGRRM